MTKQQFLEYCLTTYGTSPDYPFDEDLTEMFGSFGAVDGVYPAYHMNKLHWISVLLPDAPDDVVEFLVNVSFEATKDKRKRRKTAE